MNEPTVPLPIKNEVMDWGYCKNGHKKDEFGYCANKGCKYSR